MSPIIWVEISKINNFLSPSDSDLHWSCLFAKAFCIILSVCQKTKEAESSYIYKYVWKNILENEPYASIESITPFIKP